MNLGRIDRLYVDVVVTATAKDGTPQTLTGVDVALLAPRATPTAATTWTAATYAGGVASLLLAGPDADPTGALVVPATGADLWLRVVDNPETITALVGRITVT